MNKKKALELQKLVDEHSVVVRFDNIVGIIPKGGKYYSDWFDSYCFDIRTADDYPFISRNEFIASIGFFNLAWAYIQMFCKWVKKHLFPIVPLSIIAFGAITMICCVCHCENKIVRCDICGIEVRAKDTHITSYAIARIKMCHECYQAVKSNEINKMKKAIKENNND